MTRAEIAGALHAKGLTYSIVAEALGVSRQHVQNVVSGYTLSVRVARAIADILDVATDELFPETSHRLSQVKAEKRTLKVSELRNKFELSGLAKPARKRRSQQANAQGQASVSFGN